MSRGRSGNGSEGNRSHDENTAPASEAETEPMPRRSMEFFHLWKISRDGNKGGRGPYPGNQGEARREAQTAPPVVMNSDG